MKTILAKIHDFWTTHRQQLQANYPGLQPVRLIQEFQIYFQYFYSVKQIEKLSSLTISSSDWAKWEDSLLQGVPFAHLHHLSSFVDHELWSNNSTLIARPETELLFDKAKNILLSIKSSPLEVCDVGTGSGAIVLALACALNTPVKFIGVDLVPEALALARANEFKLGFSMPPVHMFHWLQGDRLKCVHGKFHLIVSNPPYIKQSQAHQVHPQVAKFEPATALFLPDEEYQTWFGDLFAQVWEHLHPGGFFLMEGHEDHLQDLMLLAGKWPWRVLEIQKDWSNRERFLVAQRT